MIPNEKIISPNFYLYNFTGVAPVTNHSQSLQD